MSNALKHGGPEHILVSLARDGDTGTLRMEDDGTGMPEVTTSHAGLGLRIMSYRATMVGGSLDVRRRSPQGTTICCRFPIEA